MSTAKVPQGETPLEAADFADILSTTLAMAAEAGLSVGVRNRPGEGLRATADGRLIAGELPPKSIEGHPDSGGNATVMEGQNV